MPNVTDPFRKIASLLLRTRAGEQPRALMLVSPGPGQGTSTVVASLALVLSGDLGLRTLLIDAHDRRPVLHTFFGVKREPGLADVCTGGLAMGEAARKTAYPGLFLLSAGSEQVDSVPCLHGAAVRDYFRFVREQYDVVIVDGPPILTTPDSLAIATCFDGVVLVVQAGVARVDEVSRARALLERTGVPVLGVILNRTPGYIREP